MPLQSIEPRRLYRQIAEQLRGLIRAGEYPVGARLPPERDLAAQLKVSRPSVREALIALEVEGLVEVRMGSGIYVIAPEPAPSAARVGAELSPFEIIRARQLIECELAALAAASKKPAAIARGLRDAVALMEADIAREVMPIRGDRLFHVRVAEASENSALLRVVTELYDERNNPLFERLGPPLRARGHLAPGGGRAPAGGGRDRRQGCRSARAPRCTSTCSARTTASARPGPVVIRRSGRAPSKEAA